MRPRVVLRACVGFLSEAVFIVTFRYIAVSSAGERLAGEVDGASEQAALAELDRRRLTPIELKVKPAARFRAARGPRVSAAKLATAYTQVGELLHAGVPLLRASPDRSAKVRAGACQDFQRARRRG